MGNTITVIAVILVILVIANIAGSGVQPPSGQSRRSPREQRRDSRFRAEKSIQRADAERRANRRRDIHIETARQHWQPRIDNENRKAAAAAKRAERRMNAGKNPGRAARTASRHDRRASELTGYQNKEAGIARRLWDGAVAGNAQAQKLFGRVDPKTGKITGGIGRSGYRHSDSTPPPKKTDNGGKK